MKALLARSLVVAVFVGLFIGFTDFVMSVHGISKYDPPITEEESRQLRDLPMAKAEAVFATRRKTLTRKEWLLDSIGYSYFWKSVAGHSVLPALGVFAGCVIVGGLQLRTGDKQ